jgi:hypothetical protein
MTELAASLAIPALVGLLITSAVLTLTTSWGLRFTFLAVQYALLALILAQAVVWQVAAVKALVGLLVVAILTLTGREARMALAAGPPPPSSFRARLMALRRIEFQTNLPFRIAALLLAIVTVWYLVTETGYALPGLPLTVNLAGELLVVLGLLSLGLSDEPLNAGIGLLMVLNGFEALYAPIERSLAVMALLAAVNFGAALAISHLALLRYAGPGGEA